MDQTHRNIILLVKEEALNNLLFDKEINNLHQILAQTETVSEFCKAHELVNRNVISSRKSILLKFLDDDKSRPFRFLINKN